MVLCPPFRRAARGKFKLCEPVEVDNDDDIGRRGTIWMKPENNEAYNGKGDAQSHKPRELKQEPPNGVVTKVNKIEHEDRPIPMEIISDDIPEINGHNNVTNDINIPEINGHNNVTNDMNIPKINGHNNVTNDINIPEISSHNNVTNDINIPEINSHNTVTNDVNIPEINDHDNVINDINSRSESLKSKISYRDSDGNIYSEERVSTIGRQTVAQLVQNDPDKRERRKQGVIAPHDAPDNRRSLTQYEKYDKDVTSQEQIKKAVMANEFLPNIMDEERLKAVVEAMYPQDYAAGSLIIREGESGSHLFVSARGTFQVLKGGQVVKTFFQGEVFGELSILYKAKRFASIRCITHATVWMLERRVFQKIMLRSGRQEQEDNLRFLTSVPLLQDIDPIELAKMSDFLKREFFLAGTAVVRQGERGDKFYIIRGGEVVVTKQEEEGVEKRVGVLRRGDYFGEQALLHQDRRLATVTAQPPGVECLTLERGPFTEFLGDIDELKKKRHVVPRLSKKLSQVKSEFEFVELKDLDRIGTLGVGGFGRVELVQYRRDPSLTFALKCLKKVDMVQQQQQEHAFNEKNIMMSCSSPFLCRLYRTFKDPKYIYFLMEPVLGGDVWTILQNKGYFPENVARFMVACVVEAFSYLHSKDIIYRDLKPENLMLDKQGYVKLVDFGFAKRISSNGKTWTFAGTPEYVAPEIVLNKGHDRAVDCWALGVLVHELLVGKPPFRAPGGDHMKTYNLILRGIDAVSWHPRIANIKSAQMLIRKLCRVVPAERLGYLKNGMTDVKNHKWFLGLEWEGLAERRLKAPLVQPITSNVDLTNFDKYPKDKIPPDETSGWDSNF